MEEEEESEKSSEGTRWKALEPIFRLFLRRGFILPYFFGGIDKSIPPHTSVPFQVWLDSIKNATSASSSPQASKCPPPPIQAQQDEKDKDK